MQTLPMRCLGAATNSLLARGRDSFGGSTVAKVGWLWEESLKKSLGEFPYYRTWAQQATLSGKLINKSKDRIDQETKKIKNGSVLQSDARTLSPWHR